MQPWVKFNDHNQYEEAKNPLKASKLVDTSERDLKYLHDLSTPHLWDPIKTKWVSKKDVQVLGKSTYKMTQNGSLEHKEPYIDSTEVTGDIGIKR